MDKKNEFPVLDIMAIYRKLGEMPHRSDFSLDGAMSLPLNRDYLFPLPRLTSDYGVRGRVSMVMDDVDLELHRQIARQSGMDVKGFQVLPHSKKRSVELNPEYKLAPFGELLNTLDLNPWDAPTGSRTQMFRTYQPSIQRRIKQMSAREFLDFTSNPVTRLAEVPEVTDHAFSMMFKKPIKSPYLGYQLIKAAAFRD